MIVIRATFPIDPTHWSESLDRVETLVEQSTREAGVIEYRAAVDIQEDNTIQFFEQYEDEAAVKAHNNGQHLQEFLEELPELLAGEPEVVQFEVNDATELEL